MNPTPVLQYKSPDDPPPPLEKAYSAKSLTMHQWAVGAFADYWMYAQFALISIIFTTTYKLDPKYVGIAMFFPRIVDGLIDPLVGHLSDVTHTRWGRRRPFLFVTAVIGAVLSFAIWLPSSQWPQWVTFVWLTIGATALFSTWGTYTMAHSALGYELSDDYNDRSRVFAIKGVYFSLMSIGGGYFWALALQLKDGLRIPLGPLGSISIPSMGSEINGVRVLSLVVSVIILASASFTVFFCRERFSNANRKHVNLLAACKDTLKCKPFVTMLYLQAIRTLGTSLYGTFAVYIGIYYVCYGDKKWFALASTGLGGVAGFVISTAMWPLAKPLTRWLGKRWGIILTFGIMFLNAILLPFITKPGHIYLLVFTGFAFIFPMSVQNLFLTSLMPDICDIDELQSGERKEGLFSAVKSFVDKMEISVCSLLGMFLLSWVGFDAHNDQQPHAVLVKMLWVAFTPKIIFSAIAFVLAFNLPVTEEMMDKVRGELEIQRRQGKSATPPPGVAEA